MALVQRRILVSEAFINALKKLGAQEMKLVHTRALAKFLRWFEQEYKEAAALYQKYSQLGEDGIKQLEEFLDEILEVIELPKTILQEEKINLSAQDLFALEHVLEK